MSERVYTYFSNFFTTDGAQHQHQHSMSDGVHIWWKAFGSICHTPQIWRIVFDVYTRVSDGIEASRLRCGHSESETRHKAVYTSFEEQILVVFKKMAFHLPYHDISTPEDCYNRYGSLSPMGQ